MLAERARPETPVDFAAEIDRTLTVIDHYITALEPDRPDIAAKQRRLQAAYRKRWGNVTINSTSEPGALRSAVTALTQETEILCRQVPVGAPGMAPAIFAARHTDILADLVVHNTR